ncbi:MAG: replication initiator protein A [Oscillospiraceae bacterium]|nr:replication initiator protein A [Oscillospiraceae bacterium]
MPYFKKDTVLPPFIPLPRFIVAGGYSVNAKLLYGLLLSRTMLSQKSGWVSEDGSVYVVYPIRELAEDLNRSEKTVKNALNELENAGLLSRVRQGLNRANLIFLRLPDEVQISTQPEGKIYPTDGQEITLQEGQNPPSSNNEKEYKDLSKKDRGESRTRYGCYRNVFLSDDEMDKLKAEYPDRYSEYINRLSTYMVSSGRHYANHYATIRKWLDEDKPKNGRAYDYNTTYEQGECL